MSGFLTLQSEVMVLWESPTISENLLTEWPASKPVG